ncbi:hypothetical protein Goari_001264, partial [Gossypium aridum]|nr:hypothetical protein [Gossypium aridum]
LGEIATFVVSSPKIAKEFLITHGLIFANKPYMIDVDVVTYGYRDIVMAPYGNCWRQ